MGDEGVNGLFRITSFDNLLGFFRAQVNPYEPTRNPYKKIITNIVQGNISLTKIMSITIE